MVRAVRTGFRAGGGVAIGFQSPERFGGEVGGGQAAPRGLVGFGVNDLARVGGDGCCYAAPRLGGREGEGD